MSKRAWGMVSWLVAALLVLVGLVPVGDAGALPGEDIYVSATGDDSAAGTETNPLKTLAEAFEQVDDGQTVFVLDSLDLTAVADLGGSPGRQVTLAKAANAPGDVRITRHKEDGSDFTGNMISIAAGSRLTLADSVTLDGNEVAGAASAVMVYGEFVMTGGAIVNNTTSGSGGAVYILGASNADFRMTGGEITGNTATGGGSGVYFVSGGMEVEGSPRLGTSDDDNGVYLSSNYAISQTGPLDSGARINVENRQDARVGTVIATKDQGAGQVTPGDVAAFHWQTIAYKTAADSQDGQNVTLEVDQTDFYVDKDGSDTQGTGAQGKPFETLTRVFQELPRGQNVTANVHVMSDLVERASAVLSEGDVTVATWPAGSSPAVVSRGKDSSGADFTDNMVRTTSGAKLTLENLVLDGNNTPSSLSLLTVETKATAALKDVEIRNNVTAMAGGGVNVVSGGRLEAQDGTVIKGNKANLNGGEVYVFGSSPDGVNSTIAVSGEVVIGERSGEEGVYLGADQVIEIVDDLPAQALICIEGKAGTPQVGDLLATKQGGSTVNTTEAERLYFLTQEFNVAPDTDANTYVLAEGWTSLYVKSTGSDVTGRGTLGQPYQTVTKAFSEVKAGLPARVVLLDDAVVTAAATLAAGKTARLVSQSEGGDPWTVKRDASFTGTMLEAVADASLTVANVVLDGNQAVASAGAVLSARGTVSGQTAAVTIDGATVTGARTAQASSAVMATATSNAGASVTLVSGQITGNQSAGVGGGVRVTAAGSVKALFQMDGGEVSANSATNGGGVYITGAGAQAVFTGGQVTGNTASGLGRGVYQATGNASLTVSGAPQLGTSDTDNGVYLVAGASFTQDGDLDDSARVNVENLASGVIGSLVATKTGGTVSVAEEVHYYWQANLSQQIAAQTADNTYVVDGLKDVYVAQAGSDSAGDGTSDNPFATLTKAFAAVSVTDQATVNVKDDIPDSAVAVVASGRDIVLRTDPAKAGDPAVVTRAAANVALIQIAAGGSLRLENLVVDGAKGTYTTNTSSLVYVQPSVASQTAQFTLGTGGVLRNNRASNGGAIHAGSAIANASLRVTVQDGLITGNTAVTNGGAIYALMSAAGASATLTISGGELSGNTAADGGAVCGYATQSGATTTVNVEGGSISGNSATANGGGIWVNANNSNARTYLNITGGEIKSNQAAANGGGGVVVYATSAGQSTAIMSGGVIEANQVATTSGSLSAGGGVLVYATTANSLASFTLTGGEVKFNQALNGAGIYFYTNNINTATARATLTGGTLTGNTLTAPAGRGAAVGYYGTYTGQSLTVGGSVKVGVDDGDNGVYLPSGYNINQSGSFTDADARVNIEGKLNAQFNTQVVAKTGADVSEAEAAQYLWQPGNGLAVTASTPSSYILTGAPEFYVSATGDDANGLGTQTRPFASLAKAFTAASNVAGVETKVYVMDDIKVAALATVTSGKTISVLADPDSSNPAPSATRDGLAGNLVRVESGGSLTWQDVILDGAKQDSITNSEALVYVLSATNNTTASFTLKSGALTNNAASGGGGVYAQSNSTTARAAVTVAGGEISGNTASGPGGGVYLSGALAVLTVSGGQVSGNTAGGSGGGLYVTGNGAAATVSGGEISGNTATANGGGVYLNGVGTVFNLTGGQLANNSAVNGGGAFVGTAANTGTAAVINLTGGTVTGNTLTGTNGHGAAVGFGGSYPATELLRVGGNIKLGTAVTDNGVWLPASYTIKQTSDLGASALVVLEGKVGAAASTVIADKTGGSGVSTAEADRYLWPSTNVKVAPSSTGAQYVLTGVAELYVSNTGSDSTGDGTRDNPVKTLSHAFGLAAAGTAVTVYVMDDIAVPATAVVTSGKNITVQADPQSLNQAPVVKRAADLAGNLVQVNSGGSLTWRDAILDGAKEDAVAGSEALVYVVNATNNTTASFTLQSGALTNNAAGALGEGGGGIYLRSSSATARSVMTVTGGEISANDSTVNGGGVFLNGAGAALTMSGGQISSNTATVNGGGVYVTAGAVTVSGKALIGVDGTDNGIYLGTGVVIAQQGDLDAAARINVEGRADLATNEMIANKSGGAPVDDAEAARYQWAGGGLAVITLGTTQYVLNRPGVSLYVSAAGSDYTGKGTRDKPFATLPYAFSVAPTVATVYLMTDLTATSGAVVAAGRRMRLKPDSLSSDPDEFTVSRGGLGFALVSVSGGGLFTLDGVVLDGQKAVYGSNTAPLV
ncbi:MAG: hypothetical protein LBG11_02495, partial [Bifidobacteriaceae bacterium]|nr:hypothetical protein [Bifidobacteriaceae bacterium]